MSAELYITSTSTSPKKNEEEKQKKGFQNMWFSGFPQIYDVFHGLMPGHTHLQYDISNMVIQAIIEMGKGNLLSFFSGA